MQKASSSACASAWKQHLASCLEAPNLCPHLKPITARSSGLDLCAKGNKGNTTNHVKKSSTISDIKRVLIQTAVPSSKAQTIVPSLEAFMARAVRGGPEETRLSPIVPRLGARVGRLVSVQLCVCGSASVQRWLLGWACLPSAHCLLKSEARSLRFVACSDLSSTLHQSPLALIFVQVDIYLDPYAEPPH